MFSGMTSCSRCRLLVIGYGNELRGDDGVGPAAAARTGELGLPGVEILTVHQLVPELADPISRAATVVFVDASVEELEDVQMRELQPLEDVQVSAHSSDPRGLLTLARDLFDRAPAAWMISIPVSDFSFGEQLSRQAQDGVEKAVQMVRRLAETLH
jgi:hydrogenase maturation protease